jgi:hypothetical protein
VLGKLVQTTAGKWITPTDALSERHLLRPGAALVGHQACPVHGGGHYIVRQANR